MTDLIPQKRRYSLEIKKAMVTKLVAPNGPTAVTLSRETGIHFGVLSRWVREYKIAGQSFMKKGKRPQEWTSEEKLEAIIATSNMDESELGIFLRKRGLHHDHLSQWKKEVLSALGQTAISKQNPDAKKLKSIQKELNRKDRALSELSARVILLKKSIDIWGEDEEDEQE